MRLLALRFGDDPARAAYWPTARAPWAGLLVALPLVVIYEVGLRLAPGSVARSGVEAWLRTLLLWFGFGEAPWLPFLLIVVLGVWQFASGRRRVPRRIVAGICLESLVLAAGLVYLVDREARLLGAADGRPRAAVAAIVGPASADGPVWVGHCGRAASLCGAAVYEEGAFRLLLLPLAALAAWRLGVPRGWGLAGAACLTSLVFAMAHYLGPQAQDFAEVDFLLRLFVGLSLAAIFLVRGFGVAVGTHLAYDALVWLG